MVFGSRVDSIAAMNAAVIWAALALASRRRRRAWSMATQSGLERRGPALVAGKPARRQAGP